MKVVGEREILASLVVLKHYSIAEMIRKENEKKKQKSRHPLWQKEIKRDKLQTAGADMKLGVHVDPVQIYLHTKFHSLHSPRSTY